MTLRALKRRPLTDIVTTRVSMPDTVSLAVHSIGPQDGRSVFLLHGLMSNAQTNWIRFGTAQRLADAGFRCIIPDLRGHGQSDAPTDATAYPSGVLVSDVAALIEAMDLVDYDLCGFSLGARTAAKLVIDGARPRRLILSGMGLQGLTGWARRRDFFLDAAARAGTVKRDDPAFMAVSFMRTTGIAPAVVAHVVSSFDDLAPERLGDIPMPTLVLIGTEDDDNGSASALVDTLPDGRLATIPGTHMSCITKPEFGEAIVTFLRS